MAQTHQNVEAVGRRIAETAETAAQAESAELDRAWVSRVQAGDVAAFDHLTRKYRERIYSVVYNMTSNREDASDLTQEAFIKAFTSINRFRGKSSFFTWIYRIAVNTTLSHLKKHRMRRFFSFDNLQEEASRSEIFEALASKTEADKPTMMNELQEKLNDALQSLSVKHRTVVILFEIEGLNHSEIAQILNVSEGTVRSRLHYAKQQLQSYLQDYLDS